MNTPVDGLVPSNPFSTRFVRPGALAYEFSAEVAAADLVHKFRQCGGRGQIIGPHGTGKSTLIAALVQPLTECGLPAHIVRLGDRQRRLPAGWTYEACQCRARVILIDGYEQLGLVDRMFLEWSCRWRRWGLLITAHDNVGYPTLFRTDTSLDTAQRLVAKLLVGNVGSNHAPLVSQADVAECFAAAGGSLRETFMALYDRYELRNQPERREAQISAR